MNEASTNKPRARRLVRWLLFALLALPFLVIGGCYAIFSGAALVEGGFTPKQVYSFTAPDGRSTVVVTKRIAFPANEFFDPSIIVTVELRDARTNRVIGRERLTLEEDSDLREPSVEWTPAVVRLRDMDSRYERIITIARNAEPGAAENSSGRSRCLLPAEPAAQASRPPSAVSELGSFGHCHAST